MANILIILSVFFLLHCEIRSARKSSAECFHHHQIVVSSISANPLLADFSWFWTNDSVWNESFRCKRCSCSFPVRQTDQLIKQSCVDSANTVDCSSIRKFSDTFFICQICSRKWRTKTWMKTYPNGMLYPYFGLLKSWWRAGSGRPDQTHKVIFAFTIWYLKRFRFLATVAGY